MANSVVTQIILDGHRNAIVKVTGLLDTGDVAATTIVDPANFAPLPTQFRIDKIDYSISDQLSVQLLWDATTDVVAAVLAGREDADFCRFGGLQNNAGAGKTGKIQLATTGWFSGTQTFTITLSLVKQGVAI